MVYYVSGWPILLNHQFQPNALCEILSVGDKPLFCVIDGDKLLTFSQKNLVENFGASNLQNLSGLTGHITCCQFNEDGSVLGIGTDTGCVLMVQTFFGDCAYETDLTHGFMDEDENKSERASLSFGRITRLQFTGSIYCICFYGQKYMISTSSGLVQLAHAHGKASQVITWSLTEVPFFHDAEHSKARRVSDPEIYGRVIVWAPTLGGFMSLLSSGDLCLLRFQADGDTLEKKLEGIWAERADHGVSLAVNRRFRVTAVGFTNSEVALYRVDETTGAVLIQQYLRISSREYPDAAALVGPASDLAWSPDGYALGVAWHHCGWALWSVSGGLLYTSLGERVGLADRLKLSNMTWSHDGSQIMARMVITDRAGSTEVSEHDELVGTSDVTMKSSRVVPSSYPCLAVFNLARSALTTNPTSDNHRHLVLQTADRVLFVNRTQLTTLRSPHVLTLPAFYLKHNWPLQFVGVNWSGDRIAVAGLHGLAHYNCLTQRWHVFGNEVQERSITACGGIAWWQRYICLCCHLEDYATFEIRLYPCDKRLDDQFVIRRPIRGSAVPLLVDHHNDLFTALTNDGRVHVFRFAGEEHQPDRSSVEIVAMQIIDLTNLITFPTCVVRLCLSTLMANMPPTCEATDQKRTKVDPSSSISLVARPTTSDSSLQAVDSENVAAPLLADNRRNLLHPNVRLPSTPTTTGAIGTEAPKSLVVNYAGHLFILQPSRVVEDDEELSEQSYRKQRLGPRSYVRPLLLTPFLIASGVELVWFAPDSCSYEFRGQPVDPLNIQETFALPDASQQSPLLQMYITGSLWLYCGSSGLQVWLPLPKHLPTSPTPTSIRDRFFRERQASVSHGAEAHGHLAPGYISRRVMLSLELDECVHPLVILFNEALLVGVLNDFHRPWVLSSHRIFSAPHDVDDIQTSSIFSLIPFGVLHLETHAFLHRLIQELLKRNLGVHALQLASAYENLPHFHRVLEWLLHEVLESEATSKSPIPDPLLPQVVAFIQEFPYFLETVAQCARKTEVARWPHLFTAVGRRPKDLFELCIECGHFQAAAAYLIILQSCEPIGVSQKCTLNLIEAALDASHWALIRDLLRFLNAIDPNDLKCDDLTVSKPPDKSEFRQPTATIPSVQPTSMVNQLTSVEATVELQNGPIAQTRRSSVLKSTPSIITTVSPDPAATGEKTASGLLRLSSKSDVNSGTTSLNPSLAHLIERVFTRRASELFARGNLKQLAELVVNLSPCFGGHQDTLAKWIVNQSPELHKLPNWSTSLVSLHEQFHWPLPLQVDQEVGLSKLQTISHPNTRNSSNRSFAALTEKELIVRRQLRYLLSQLLQAGSFEWASLVALMVLDRNGLFHAITLAVDAATQCTLSRLRHWSSPNAAPDAVPVDQPSEPHLSTGRAARLWRRVTGHQAQPVTDKESPPHSVAQTSPVFGDPLSRVFAGLNQVDSWSIVHCPAYHSFLGSLQPELDQLIEQATSFFGQCASASKLHPSAQTPSTTSVAYVHVDSTTPGLAFHTTKTSNGHAYQSVARVEQVQLVTCENPLSEPNESEKSQSDGYLNSNWINTVESQDRKLIQSLPHPPKIGVMVHSLDRSSSMHSVGHITLSPPSTPALWHAGNGFPDNWSKIDDAVDQSDSNCTTMLRAFHVNSDVIYADDHVVDGTSEVNLQRTLGSSYSCVLS